MKSYKVYYLFEVQLYNNNRFNIPFKLINLANKAHTGLFFTHDPHYSLVVT